MLRTGKLEFLEKLEAVNDPAPAATARRGAAAAADRSAVDSATIRLAITFSSTSPNTATSCSSLSGLHDIRPTPRLPDQVPPVPSPAAGCP
jgi:hypothetical protein